MRKRRDRNKGAAVFGRSHLAWCSALFLSIVSLVAVRPWHSASALEGELFCEQEAHTHTDACYAWKYVCKESAEDAALTQEPICGQEQHLHAEICFHEDGTVCCEQPEHAHAAACYVRDPGEEHIHAEDCRQKVLSCTVLEHEHTELCLSNPSADIEQPEDWEAALPDGSTNADPRETLALIAESQYGYCESAANFRLADDGTRCGYTRYGAWYGDPYGDWNGMFAAFCLHYAGVSSEIVPHAADAASMYKTAAVQTLADGAIPARGMLVFYTDEGGTVRVGIIVRAGDSKLTMISGDMAGAVSQITLAAEDAKILGFSDPSEKEQKDTGKEAEAFALQPRSIAKADKDNTSALGIIRGVDTREFITLNLYNYGDNINDKYRSDKKYPGFQQEYGQITAKSTADSNFGNNITADLSAGINGLTLGASGINRVVDSANSPISKVLNVMYPTRKDGYPALADGTSLGYLFGADSKYGKRQNDKNITGLFQYQQSTGAYTYNSRENHAQFHASTDAFTLYRQKLTPNMTLYPFGNFLPFNDIVHDAKQVSAIDRNYLASVAASAQAKQDAGKSTYSNEYGTLASAMTQWIACMDTAHPNGWTAAQAIDAYFNAHVGSGFDFSKNTALLDSLYCLDYDVPTDFYFGLEMAMTFMQPRNGLTGADGKQPMRFYFTGDDDVWVYVDDVLFLDLSGIHRHVGGEIDFVSGTVRYFSLDPGTGDVSATPWREVRFSDLLGSTDGLNANGTFENYSVHDLHFYYLERGSGSGVCCLNFNMPLLRENAISITKELTVDSGSADLLGNPDFRFQLLKESGEPFVEENREYTVYDAAGNKVETRTTQGNGVVAIKAGETAVIAGIAENAGRYFVRELLSSDAFSQYGTVSVDGSVITSDSYTNVVIGSEAFSGVDSAVKDAAEGAAAFHFQNTVTTKKLGALSIEKQLKPYADTGAAALFSFRVLLDTDPLPVGTDYIVMKPDGSETTGAVEKEGQILLAAGETAKIERILAGTRFIVEERGAEDAGYAVEYVVDDSTVTDGYASGTIALNSVAKVVVINAEQGVTVRIPVRKMLTVADGDDVKFPVILEQLAAAEDTVPMSGGTQQTLLLPAGAKGEFILHYAASALPEIPVKYYYRIREQTPQQADAYRYDTSQYLAEITVTRDAEGVLSAEVTKLLCDGEPYTAAELRFENTRLTSLTIEKTVEGTLAQAQKKYRFSLTLALNGAALQGVYPCSGTAATEIAFDAAGSAVAELSGGESITIEGLPYGAAWSLTELDVGNMTVSIGIDDGDIYAGNTAAGTLVQENGTVVHVHNADPVPTPTPSPMPTPPPLVQTGHRYGTVLLCSAAGFALLGVGWWFVAARKRQ